MKRKGLTLTAIVLVVLLAAVFVAQGFFGFPQEYKQELLQNEVLQLSVPLYRSLRKLPDILFIPRYAFSRTKLETVELSISPALMERMNAQLPTTPFASGMTDENKFWVSAYFRAPGYEGNVDVRYRGDLAAHWNAYQKSYLIKFPKDNLFRGMRELALVIPSRRGYFAMSLNNYRAKKLELLYPDEQYVHFKVNGADSGVMLAFENWSQEWIEKLPVSPLSSLYGVDEGTGPYRERWKHWTADEYDPAPLDALLEVVEHADDETFRRVIPHLIDVEDFLKWDVMFILAGGYHVTEDSAFGANNLVLLFDRAEGRFKPVPYNTSIYTDSFREEVDAQGLIGAPTLLHKRLLAIPEFRAQRDEYVKTYLSNNKDDDIAFIEQWREGYDREFFMDNAKNANNFMYLSEVAENIETMIRNFSDPYNALAVEYPIPTQQYRPLSLPSTYNNLLEASVTPQAFVRSHPSFLFDGEQIRLRSGLHVFREDVVIPAGTRFIIEPGARIALGMGASIFSYSPVSAEGTAAAPIRFYSATDDPWGVFAVLNTGKKESVFTWVTFEHGGEDVAAGVTFSGMLALHNSDARITRSTFINAHGDDGLNVKGGTALVEENVFTDNTVDGIDVDFPKEGTVVRNNNFVNNNGDAIDLSWSNIEIKENIVSECMDKGISVGERSAPNIHNNVIGRCVIGIAVKDSSFARITDNIILKNITPVALYQKKPYFTGGSADIRGNIFSDNGREIQIDARSTVQSEGNITKDISDISFPEWVPASFVHDFLEQK